MAMQLISLRVPKELLAAIESRGDERSDVIRRDLMRLYRLYERALRQVDFSVAEAALIADALNGTIMGTDSAALLLAKVEDAIRLDGLDAKWGVDGAALVEKLRGLSEIQALAIVDAAERYWRSGAAEIGDTGRFEERIREIFEIREKRG